MAACVELSNDARIADTQKIAGGGWEIVTLDVNNMVRYGGEQND
jgi:hypothetical protein